MTYLLLCVVAFPLLWCCNPVVVVVVVVAAAAAAAAAGVVIVLVVCGARMPSSRIDSFVSLIVLAFSLFRLSSSF